MQPDALLMNYVNPMAANSIGMGMASDIPFVGLCHGVQTTLDLIAGYVGEKKEDIDFVAAGINHMAWFLKLEKDGVDLYPKFREVFEQPEYFINDKVRGETMRHFGYFMTESQRPPVGVSALLPQEPDGAGPYCDQPGFGGASGAYYYFCDMLARKYQEVDYLSFEQGDLTPRSNEYCSNIIEALETDKIFRFNGNVINKGYISQPAGRLLRRSADVRRPYGHAPRVGGQAAAAARHAEPDGRLGAAPGRRSRAEGRSGAAVRRGGGRPAHLGRAHAQGNPRHDG